jgi:hypothetical protein
LALFKSIVTFNVAALYGHDRDRVKNGDAAAIVGGVVVGYGVLAQGEARGDTSIFGNLDAAATALGTVAADGAATDANGAAGIYQGTTAAASRGVVTDSAPGYGHGASAQRFIESAAV